MPQTSLKLASQQGLAMSPRLQQAVRLLQLSSLDFAQEVSEVVAQNPFLEQGDPLAELAHDGTPIAADVAANDEAPSFMAERAGLQAEVLIQDADEAWVSGGAPWATSGSRQADQGDDDMGLVNSVPAVTRLRPYLHVQANALKLSDRERALVGLLIESLDDDGYLRQDLAELAALAGLEPVVDEQELVQALTRVQSMEPTGVGARHVQECLALQISEIEGLRQQRMARAIIRDHLDLLATRDTDALARILGQSQADVHAVCERIRHMDPHPGWRYSADPMAFIVPDVVARFDKGQWVVSLNPAVVPKVSINQACSELFQRHRDARHAELAAHLRDARWMVRNVEQRFHTILCVARLIVQRQHLFLEYGEMGMRPLSLRDVAQELGLHESTVSRVINNKYMATRSGVFELKRFFSRAVHTSNGGICSTVAIRGLIKDIIDSEDPTRPYSDVAITRLLARQGLAVARRTVTKYRQMMNIEMAGQRRQRRA
ncbi:MAG: RNA polymerase factor sigma-54 [Aquabacterium sp.]|uniref:RNA polymerase factor sigma-54 n=1 Tax=Aquabacterium sp. TaxID=1872578 RepID=UPI0025BCDF80|nr:RNA polymerase factor sigma-54 [Aquabacterium sp.]MBI3382210.1 RNA polymerase factor sigma-54 [Aquabacterium sp.]